MIRLIFQTCFFLFSVQLFGQFAHCDSLVIRGHQTLFDRQGINTTHDYVKKYFPEQYRYISDRNTLDEVSLILNLDSTMVFWDGSDKIVITFRNMSVNAKDIFYPKTEGEPYSSIREYAEGYPFGIISEDTTASYISEIRINNKILPVSYFTDLLNPNRYETILSIRPIEVYKSLCGQYFFVYVFGKPNSDIMTIYESVNFSYMAKIVISRKGYYVDRIVISGDKLKYFGFGDCPYFKGF